MGFLDNFKQAMEAAKEAANANIERQRAEKAAAEAAQKPQAQTRPQQARPQARPQSKLPEGVVMTSLMDMEPIALGTNSQGLNVQMKISGAILAKPMGASSLDEAGQREEVKAIARETLAREPTQNIDSMGDVKFLMLEANRLNRTVIADLNARGYQAAFKMPLFIRPL